MRNRLATVLAVALLAACGEGEPTATATTATTATTAPTAPGADPAPAVNLRLTVRSGEGRVARARLRCTNGAATGTGYARRPATARRLCRAARRLRDTLAEEPPKDRVCTEIYGGPQKATIRGTIGTATISRRFSRINGCAIADWDAVRPLLAPSRIRTGP